MHSICHDRKLAILLTKAFAGDGYFTHYFQPNCFGTLTRYNMFFDDVATRRRTGLVLREGPAVALVGLPPNALFAPHNLSWTTKLFLRLQGKTYRSRWRRLWPAGHQQELVTCAYLSAIACPAESRNRGIGTQLLRRVISAAVTRGLSIECQVSSLELCRWYEKHGFRLIDQNQCSSTFVTYDLRLDCGLAQSRRSLF
jgi:hypothetical protein